MSDVYALPKLYADVQAWFTDNSPIATEFKFGFREAARQLETNARIVFCPGDRNGGRGQLGPAIYPGGPARQLYVLPELAHVVISASDPSDPENEEAQYAAVTALWEQWAQSVCAVAGSTLQWVSSDWVVTAGLDSSVSRVERRYGAAIVETFTVLLPVLDTTSTTLAPVDTKAVVDVIGQTSLEDDATVLLTTSFEAP